MQRINKSKIIYAGIIFIFCMIIALLNKDYFMSALFLVCTFASLLVSKSDNFYEYIYCTLIVSAIFEYTYSIPHSSKIYVFHLFLAIFTLANIVRVAMDRQIIARFKSKFIYFYAFFFVYIIATYAWAINRGAVIKYIVIYAMMFLLLTNIIIFNDSRRNFNITFRILLVMFTVSIVVGIVELLFGTQLPVVHYYDRFSQYKLSAITLLDLHYRPISFFYNPNNYGTFITIFIPFILYYAFTCKEKLKKVLAFILIILSLIVLVLTTSRATFAAMGLILLVYAFILFKEKGIKALIYPLVFVLCFGAIYKNAKYLTRHTDLNTKMSALNKAYLKVEKGDNVVGNDGSIYVRLTILYDVVHGVTTDKHIVGFGAGNTAEYIKYKGNTHKTYDPHGWFIELFGDFGIPFTILYVIFYLALIRALYRKGRLGNNNKYICYGLCTATAGFFFGSFAPSSVTYFLPHWILFGLSLSPLLEYKD